MPIRGRAPTSLHYDLYPASSANASMVVLLHGMGSCGQDWGLQIPALRSRFRVLTPDLPGHGGSEVTSPWPTIGDMASAVNALVEGLGEAKVHLVGLSLGGAVGLQLAIDHPQRVRSLTAVNTFARLRLASGGFGRGMNRTWLALFGRMDVVGRRVAELLFPGPELEPYRQVAAARLSSNPSRMYLRLLAAVARFDARPGLGRIRAPTLIVAGDRDTTVAMSAKTELASRIPGARLVVVPGSGHATPIDATDVFNALLCSFLDEVEAEEAREVVAGRGGAVA